MFDRGNKPETAIRQGETVITRIAEQGSHLAHYVVGSAYVLAHLATFGIRVRHS